MDVRERWRVAWRAVRLAGSGHGRSGWRGWTSAIVGGGVDRVGRFRRQFTNQTEDRTPKAGCAHLVEVAAMAVEPVRFASIPLGTWWGKAHDSTIERAAPSLARRDDPPVPQEGSFLRAARKRIEFEFEREVRRVAGSGEKAEAKLAEARARFVREACAEQAGRLLYRDHPRTRLQRVYSACCCESSTRAWGVFRTLLPLTSDVEVDEGVWAGVDFVAWDRGPEGARRISVVSYERRS